MAQREIEGDNAGMAEGEPRDLVTIFTEAEAARALIKAKILAMIKAIAEKFRRSGLVETTPRLNPVRR